jgi:predicted transcriptional regulator
MGKRGPKPKVPAAVVVYERDKRKLTYQRIADNHGITRQRAHQIYKYAKEKE